MKIDYDKSDIPSSYVQSRQLPERTLELWFDEISRHVRARAIEVTIEIGCGTGRFSPGLSRRFSAMVYGIDPSFKMLSLAARHSRSQSILYIAGIAEAIPLPGSCADIIFMSQVFHHLGDTSQAICEFKRVLKKSGMVCVRNSTLDTLNSYLYLRFFPEAYELDKRFLPSRAGIIGRFEDNGFQICTHVVVKQMFAEDMNQYIYKIGLRGLSDLASLSDESFNRGFRLLKEHGISQRNDDPILEDIDLFFFTTEV